MNKIDFTLYWALYLFTSPINPFMLEGFRDRDMKPSHTGVNKGLDNYFIDVRICFNILSYQKNPL